MISPMASFTKARCELRRLPALMLKHCSLSIYGVYGIQNALYKHEAQWKAEERPTLLTYLIWNFPPNAFLHNIVHTQNIKCSFSFLLLSNKHQTLNFSALCTQKNTHRRFSVSEVLGDSELLHLSLCFSPDRCNFLHQRAAPSKCRGFLCPGKWSVDCPRRQTRGIH